MIIKKICEKQNSFKLIAAACIFSSDDLMLNKEYEY